MRVSIFGYGVTTTPLVAFLNDNAHKLCIYDDKFHNVSKDSFGNALLPPSHFIPQKSDIEILSPGIPPSHPLVKNAQNLVSEYDYFANLLESDFAHHKSQMPYMIWISGTNGKTTTTEMTTMLLESHGAKSGGNIGTPLAELYRSKPSIWVLETSSFTLHYTHKAYPRIYALLPIKEDHITWHGSFENYIASKLSVLMRMDSSTVAFIPQNFITHPAVQAFKGVLISYENSEDLARKCGINIADITFKEPFLLDSILALCIAKYAFKADNIALLNTFTIGRHRIEEFYDSCNRLWVDDSKGTNVDATIAAIERYSDRHIMLILGGDDKGANLTPLFESMRGLDIEIFSIGSNESRLKSFAADYALPITICGNLARAIDSIKQKRAKNANDVVLLSPAAASLDQFSSYKERGEMFRKMALES